MMLGAMYEKMGKGGTGGIKLPDGGQQTVHSKIICHYCLLSAVR